MKSISLFFVFFSCFILINASIGASSAPFYDKYTECSKYELSPDCKKLKSYTSALYGFEVVGSLVLVIHGLLGMTLLEYIKKVWLIRTLNYYTKVALILYSVDVLLRTAMYIKILKLVAPVEEESHDQDFGGYLAVYCSNDLLAVLITSILMCIYVTCFLSTCYMWRLTEQLHVTAREFHAEKERAEARLNGGSETSSKNNSVQSITEEEKEAGEKAFADFDYNKDKIKKAS